MKSKTLAITLLMVGLSGCKMTAQDLNITQLTELGQKLLKAGTVSTEQELALGDDFAAMLLGATRLHPNQQLQQYVNQVGRHLASQSTRPDLPWTFAVLDTPDLNAFAIPGGYVFVTSGLLANLQSEAELAGVLAHEISHVTERHHLAAIERDHSIDLLKSLAVVAADYHAKSGSRPSAQAYQNRQIAQSVLKAGHQLYTQGLSRDDELQADAKALQLCARAGYDPFAFAAVLQHLDSVNAQSNAISLLLATHPTPADRLSQLQPRLETLATQSGQTLTARYQHALGR